MKNQPDSLNLRSVGLAADLALEFTKVSAQLNELFVKLGVPLKNEQSDENVILTVFNSLLESKKQEILNRLNFYADICASSISNSYAGLNDNRVTWYAIKKLGMIPPPGLFEQIKDSDCIEIYDGEGIQIFRNFNFCEHVTYSIQDCLIYAWDQLYKRSEDIIGVMMAEAGKALLEAREPFYSKIPVHNCTEIKTENRRQYQVRFNIISPLFDKDGKTSAFLVTSRLQVLCDIGADKSKELR